MSQHSGIRVKICGLTQPEQAAQAADAGAAYVGLVFFPRSPRSVTPDQALQIAGEIPAGVAKVALCVDPDDELIQTLGTLPIDMVQLHGHENVTRVAEIRTKLGLPIMKAIGVRDAEDLDTVATYAPVVDQVLVDAKPPEGSVLPGGNGLAFDWQLLTGRRWPVPWMLAGGLTPENVADAVRLTGAKQIDVSSGVESAPGEKDPALVEAFIRAATGPVGAI